MGPVARCRGYRAPGSPPRGAKARPSASSFGSRAQRSCCRRPATPPLTATSSTRKARAAQAGPLSALSGAVRATRGAARAARHSPRQAVQRHCSLANVAHRSRRLPTKQQSAAPACSGGCGAAAPSPRPVHGAGARRHGSPPVAGGAHLQEHQMLPQHTQLCAAQRTGHATQSRPSVCPRGCLRKAWQARARLLRGHALRPGERATNVIK